MSGVRYFPNPYAEYTRGAEKFDDNFTQRICQKIHSYIDLIVQKTWTGVGGMHAKRTNADLYVGDAGIAYMFLRLQRCNVLRAHELASAYSSSCSSSSAVTTTDASTAPTRDYVTQASNYVQRALKSTTGTPSKLANSCAFLCGPAGVHAVAAVLSHRQNAALPRASALTAFSEGLLGCEATNWDELLVGRAGYLSGIHWLNSELTDTGAPAPFSTGTWSPVAARMLRSGREYVRLLQRDGVAAVSPALMYQYHGTEYLGAAHGLAGILQVMLARPQWMRAAGEATKAAAVWSSIDWLVALQDPRTGDFPTAVDSEERGDRQLVHWCHGAAGVVHLLLQAHLRQPGGGASNSAYLTAARRAAEAIWQRGLLRKGPGLCHGVGGNGLAQLVMYRVTGDPRYLYRAACFADFLDNAEFVAEARTPDRPYSLYEGVAGTVCFLCDLLEPEKAAFPFMELNAD